MSNWVKDTAERVSVTFLEAVLGVFTLDAITGAVTGFNVSWQHTVGIAGLTAGYSFVKALIAKLKGDPESASLADL